MIDDDATTDTPADTPDDNGPQDAADEPEAPAAPETLEAALKPDSGQQDSTQRGGKYREKLHAAETERDTLRERLTTMQRAEAERLAAARLSDPADLFRDGLELADLLDADGQLDPAKVNEAANTITSAHPHWRRPPAPKAAPGPGAGSLQSGSRGPDHTPRLSFTDAFAPASRRDR